MLHSSCDRTVQEGIRFTKRNSRHAPITSSGHPCRLLHQSSTSALLGKRSAAVRSGLFNKVRGITAQLVLCPLSLVGLGRFLDFVLRPCSLWATVLLLGLLVILFNHPDHCLPSGVAILQLLESLGHLGKWKLGLHYWQDLQWTSRKISWIWA